MEYRKPPLSFEQQAALILSRGLDAEKAQLIEILRYVSYYRLSGYLYPFRNADDTFRPGTTLEQVWNRYTFDRRLRVLFLDAIDRVEIAVRTSLVYHHSHTHEAFGYLDHRTLPKLNDRDFNDFLKKIEWQMKKSNESFVQHFKQKYGDNHSNLPLWMAIELMSFGNVVTFFRGMERQIKKDVSAGFRVPFKVMQNWLLCLNTVRNICAHHGRIWNRVFGTKLTLPRKDLQWHTPVELGTDRVFGILTVLRYLLGIVASQSQWQGRLGGLIQEYPQIPLHEMGFPENWRDCPVWQIEQSG